MALLLPLFVHVQVLNAVEPEVLLDFDGEGTEVLEPASGNFIRLETGQFLPDRSGGRALVFSGDNRAVGIPWKSRFSDRGSMLFWLKPEGEGGTVIALTAGGVHFANNHLKIAYDGASQSLLAESRWKGEKAPYHWRGGTAKGSVPIGQWTQVTLVQDGQGVKIYLNGQLSATITEGNESGSWTDIQGVSAYQRSRWLLGGDLTKSGQGFQGLIDDLLITNEVLSERDILQDYQGDSLADFGDSDNAELALSVNGKRERVSMLGKWDFTFVPPGGKAGEQPDSWTPIYLKEERMYAKPWWRYGVDLGEWKARDIDIVWYRKTVDIPENLPEGRRLILHFDAVAFTCEVYWNGELLGRNLDGFLPFEFDITDKVRPGEPNELVLQVGSFRVAKSMGAPIGAMYDQHGGIWQPAWLESRGAAYVDSVFIQPSVRYEELTVDIENAGEVELVDSVRITFFDGDTRLGAKAFPVEGREGVRLTIPWENPDLWWPENPKLYQLGVELLDTEGHVIDRTLETFGFREVWIEGNDFYLNGKKIHLYGRWGHTGQYYAARRFAGGYLSPDELWTAHKEGGGINTVRLHCQPLPEIFLDEADRQGMLLISETALNHRPDTQVAIDHAVRMVERDRNHPSVVLWSGSNEFEHWKVPRSEATSYYLAMVRDAMHEADPTRPVSHSAYGPTDGNDDVINYHYPERMRPYVNNWPNELFWPVDQSVCKKRETTGNYMEGDDRDKPIMIGEMLPPWRLEYAEGYGQDYFTLSAEEREALDLEQKPFWFSRALIVYRMLDILHVGQSIGGSGYVDNPMKVEMARLAYAPLVGMFYPWCSNYWADEPVESEVWISNDDLEDFVGTLHWQLISSEGEVFAHGKEPVVIKQGRTAKVPLSARVGTVPAEGTWLEATWMAHLEGTLGSETEQLALEQPILIFSRKPDALKLQRKLAVWSDAAVKPQVEALLPWLEGATEITDISSLEALVPGQSIIMLPGAMDAATQESLARSLAAFVDAGGRLLVLDQENWATGWLPLDIRLSSMESNNLFPGSPLGSAFSELPEAGLQYWQDDHRVVRRPLVASTAGRCRPLVDYPVTAVSEAFFGQGVYLFSQILVQEKLEADPMAGRLLQALLHYLDEVPVPAERVTYLWGAPEGRYAQAVVAAGAELAGADNALAELPDFAGDVQLLVDGASVDLSDLWELRNWVGRGGRMVFHNLDAEQIATVGQVFGLDLTAGETPERVRLLPDKLNAGLSPYAVAFGDKAWPRANVPVVVGGTVAAATEPLLWGSVPYGMGELVFDQSQWEFENKDYEKASAFGRVFLINLGVPIGALPVTGGSEQIWHPIVLEAVYNAPLVTEYNKRNPDGRNIDAGKLLRGEWPRGRQSFEEIDVLMPDPVSDEEPSIIRVNARRQEEDGTWVETFPGGESRVSVPVPRVHADELAFVHGYLRLWGTPYRPPQPTPLVMTYRVCFESGREIEIPVYSAQHLRPVRTSVQSLPKAELAFQTQEVGGEDAGETTAYYLMRWRNPHPEEKIKRIEIEASEQSAHMPIVLAISYAASEVAFD